MRSAYFACKFLLIWDAPFHLNIWEHWCQLWASQQNSGAGHDPLYFPYSCHWSWGQLQVRRKIFRKSGPWFLNGSVMLQSMRCPHTGVSSAVVWTMWDCGIVVVRRAMSCTCVLQQLQNINEIAVPYILFVCMLSMASAPPSSPVMKNIFPPRLYRLRGVARCILLSEIVRQWVLQLLKCISAWDTTAAFVGGSWGLSLARKAKTLLDWVDF